MLAVIPQAQSTFSSETASLTKLEPPKSYGLIGYQA